MRPTVLLFDIDGTLVSSGGAGRRAMERAMLAITGRDDTCGFGFSGMTDRAIARQALRGAGHEDTEAAIDGVLDAYLEILAVEVPRSTDFKALPGVVAVVEAARQSAGVAVGLGTGNVRRGASIKLRRVDLERCFDFGGFGCDHEERARLLAAGAERGAERLGKALAQCRVVVIGDTPKDVAAALAIGAECVGVATGRFDVASLAAAGATHSFATLEAPGARTAILGT